LAEAVFAQTGIKIAPIGTPKHPTPSAPTPSGPYAQMRRTFRRRHSTKTNLEIRSKAGRSPSSAVTASMPSRSFRLCEHASL
jgi:hypothetical protein